RFGERHDPGVVSVGDVAISRAGGLHAAAAVGCLRAVELAEPGGGVAATVLGDRHAFAGVAARGVLTGATVVDAARSKACVGAQAHVDDADVGAVVEDPV